MQVYCTRDYIQIIFFIYQTIILILYDLVIFSGETCRANLLHSRLYPNNFFIYQTIILILYDLVIFSRETCRAHLMYSNYI